jgi:hypothetical protein
MIASRAQAAAAFNLAEVKKFGLRMFLCAALTKAKQHAGTIATTRAIVG